MPGVSTIQANRTAGTAPVRAAARREVVIRDAEFGRRLVSAIDNHPHAPPPHKGRLRWFADEMDRRFGKRVSEEGVRKWIIGENKPRDSTMAQIAEMLRVDPAWLAMGLDANLRPRETKVRNAMASGAVNIVAGLIQMDGGYPAFPKEDDQRAKSEHLDLYAIIKGAQYSIHVALGQAEGEGVRFAVPVEADKLIVLGVVRDEGFKVRIFELPWETIEAFGKRRGGSIEVNIGNIDDDLTEIQTFANRL